MLSLTKKLYFKYKRSRIKKFDDLLYYLEKITTGHISTGLMFHLDLEETDNVELFPLINQFNPSIDTTYMSELITSFNFFFVLYTLYDGKKPIHLSSNLFKVYLKDRFDQDMFQYFIHKYDIINQRKCFDMLNNVVDSDGTILLNFFVNTCLNEWHKNNNPDYLLMFIKSYFELHHSIKKNIENWFFDIDILREYITDILCLVNDHYPIFLELAEPIDHERLKTAYNVSCALEIPLMEAINNNYKIQFDEELDFDHF